MPTPLEGAGGDDIQFSASLGDQVYGINLPERFFPSFVVIPCRKPAHVLKSVYNAAIKLEITLTKTFF